MRGSCRLVSRIHFVSLDHLGVHSPGIFADFLCLALPVVGRLELVSYMFGWTWRRTYHMQV